MGSAVELGRSCLINSSLSGGRKYLRNGTFKIVSLSLITRINTSPTLKWSFEDWFGVKIHSGSYLTGVLYSVRDTATALPVSTRHSEERYGSYRALFFFFF